LIPSVPLSPIALAVILFMTSLFIVTIEMLTNCNGYNELSLAAKKLPMAKIVITKELTEKQPKISNNA
jgi:hypothetical protein